MRIFLIGAAGGIGSAAARRLRPSADLVLCGRDAAKLAALATELDCPYESLNAANFDALERAVAAHGPIDAIVNCAGSLILRPAHATSEREFHETIEQSLTTAFSTVRAGAKALMSTGGGSIVLCATAAARAGFPNHDAIAAAKGGVIGLTLSAAATYGPRNIRVNCVAPGLVETPLTARITGNETARAASQSMHALGRIGKPEDVASAIAWLVNPENSWVTGQILGVDGGLGSARTK